MTAHKHAALMLQYAQDAQITDKPWELWEIENVKFEWVTLISSPDWNIYRDYRRKSAKWQPVGGDWFISGLGCVVDAASSSNSKNFGAERPTKEQADRAAVEMRRFNRLLALRDELCGDGDWVTGDNNYFVYYDYEDKRYEICSNTIMKSIGTPYFTSKEFAQRACDMLNSGEVEL